MRGVFIKNDERLEELNNRIYNRNVPSHTVTQTFDPRPTNTRQQLYPMYVSKNMEGNMNTYDIQYFHNKNISESNGFNPGKGPYVTYANNIDKETQLQDRFMVKQKWTPQTKYIPNSDSDLYKTQVYSSKYIENPHKLLNEQPYFAPFNPNIKQIGTDVFNNHTRNQIRNLNN